MGVCPDIDLSQRYSRALELWKEERYLELLELTTESIALSEYLELGKMWVKTQKLQAMAYYKLQYYEKSLEKYQLILDEKDKAIKYYDHEILYRIKYGMALSKRFQGNINEAYGLLVEILENSKDNHLKTKTVISMSNVLRDMYQISNESGYLDQAISVLQTNIKSQHLSDYMESFYKATLGLIYLHKQKKEEALELLTDVLKMTDKEYLISHVMNELAWLYILEKSFDKSKKYLDDSKYISEKDDDKEELARNHYLRGLWYKEQDLYEKSEYYLKKSSDILEETYILMDLLNVSYQLFKLHEKVNPAKAAKYFTTCQQIKEKIDK